MTYQVQFLRELKAHGFLEIAMSSVDTSSELDFKTEFTPGQGCNQPDVCATCGHCAVAALLWNDADAIENDNPTLLEGSGIGNICNSASAINARKLVAEVTERRGTER